MLDDQLKRIHTPYNIPDICNNKKRARTPTKKRENSTQRRRKRREEGKEGEAGEVL